MSQSGLTPYQDECLLILMEECSETIQEICKIQRFGMNATSHHTEGKSHLECLEQELGDLLAMIEMVRDSGIGITEVGLFAAKLKKRKKVVQWMTHTDPIEKLKQSFQTARAQQDNYKRKDDGLDDGYNYRNIGEDY